MADLNQKEQIKVAIMCAKKGMPLDALSNIGIDVSSFPVNDQAKIRAMFACNRLDKSINNKLR